MLNEKWWVVFDSDEPPPIEDVVALAGLGFKWIEPEPTGGSTYLNIEEPDRKAIPISDYIAKRRSDETV